MLGEAPSFIRRCIGLLSFWMLLATVLVLTPSTAQASRIRSQAVVATPYGAMPRSFAQFLKAGPSVWSKVQPKVPSGLRLMSADTGALQTGTLVDYLTWRRSLNPARFDRYHPNVAAMLLVPPPVTPTIAVTPPTPAQPQVVPRPVRPVGQTVPEPSSWLVGVGLVATMAWVRRKRPRPANLVD